MNGLPTLQPGDVVEMGSATVRMGDLTLTYATPKKHKGKPKRHMVFLYLGELTEGEPAQPDQRLNALGWKFEG